MFTACRRGCLLGDPAARTNKYCEEIANGRLAMMTVIGMFSACRRGWLLEPGCEDQQVLRGDRERPPGHDGSHRHVPCGLAPVGFWDPASKTNRFCEEIGTAAWP
jgi:hypothetical protein